LEAIEGLKEYVTEATVYGYIAFYYSYQGDEKNELKYARLSLEQALKSDNPRQMMSSWESLAEAYFYSHEYPAAIEAYNEARTIYLEKLKHEEQDEDLKFRDNMHYMVSLVNLGSMYSYNGDIQTAVRLVTEALEVADLYNMVETQAYCHKELGRFRMDLKEYPVSEKHFLKAIELLASDYVYTAESYHIDYEVKLGLAALYGKMGEYSKSAALYEEAIGKYRTLHDEEQIATNQQLAASYETEKQEAAIARMETIVSYHERQRYIYAGILVAILAVLFFTAKLYRTRIVLARQLEQALRDKAKMLELEKRRTELDSHLKQNEAESLEQKLMLGNSLREQRNRALDELTGFFEKHPSLSQYHNQVKSIILQENRIDSNMDDYRLGINSVPLDFYIRLQKIADNRLTSLDLKYCRLFYLDTSNRDIADLLSVEQKTVRMNRYRLKQKLGLAKEDDLNDFIKNLANG